MITSFVSQWAFQVEQRSQAQEKTIVDYILAKLALINRPHAGMQLCERDKLKLIRRALYSWELRSALLANVPNTVNDLLATVRDKEESMRSPLGGGVMAAIHAAARMAFIPPSAPPYVSPPAPVTYVTHLLLRQRLHRNLMQWP